MLGRDGEELLGMFCVSVGDIGKKLMMELHLAGIGWEETKYGGLISRTGSQVMCGVDVHGIELDA